MAYSKEVTVNGLNKTYSISPKCKKYTLRDNGFEEQKNGSFQLVRSLDTFGIKNKSARVKVTVSKEITELKISTTTANGLNTIDLYKMSNNDMVIEKFEFILDGLVDRDVLIEVEN